METKIKLPTLEDMLKSGMHFGHKTSRWHPKMQDYIFCQRSGIHIIDLAKSRKMLGEAVAYMDKLISEGKIILFVGTKNQAKMLVQELAKELGMPYVSERWLGGTLTNFTVIKRMVRKYKDLVEKKNAGKLDRYTKKERLNFEREIQRLEKKVGGLVNLDRIPDAVFVWDIKTEETAVLEAHMKKVPIIAICDTNVNPEKIRFVIPCNDDATKAVKLVTSTIRASLKK